MAWTGDGKDIKVELERPNRSANGKEIAFDVVFRNLKPCHGGMLQYEISWAYPDAFRSHDELSERKFNSVGLRAGRRHSIRDASLTVRFQRNYSNDGEELSVFEQPPRLSVHESSLCPSADDPRDFWYAEDGWKLVTNGGYLKSCPRRSNVLYEVYRFQKSNFSGHVRMHWVPSQNYHIQRQPTRASLPGETGE